jgi:hypothetical protein
MFHVKQQLELRRSYRCISSKDSRDASVGITTGLRAGDLDIEVPFSTGTR